DVGRRVDRVIARLGAIEDRAILFSSAHVLRVLTARWLGLPASQGTLFKLDTASVSVLAYEHDDRQEPVVALWNEV
ncbi:MAG TPA: histidine phosphatase family protein, partial [Roseiarcus sp.]|nr:histidine phosphatase family protein [Roseiarcus sp.]